MRRADGAVVPPFGRPDSAAEREIDDAEEAERKRLDAEDAERKRLESLED